MELRRARRAVKCVYSALVALALGGCAPVEARTSVPPTQALWTEYRAKLADLRAARPTKPYVARVRLAIVSPRTGRRIEARGALAVDPRKAARLVMVGPGGMTALDAWVTPERYRIEVPAIHKQQRGGRALDDTFGVPVGFLRWWILAPLEGELLTVDVAAEGSAGATPRMVLRDGPSTFAVTAEKDRITVLRRTTAAAGEEKAQEDVVRWFAPTLAPAAGQHGEYLDRVHGIAVDVVVEDVMPDPPDPAAFVDPDDAEKGQVL